MIKYKRVPLTPRQIKNRIQRKQMYRSQPINVQTIRKQDNNSGSLLIT